MFINILKKYCLERDIKMDVFPDIDFTKVWEIFLDIDLTTDWGMPTNF
jgi:hypothetical protein